ncbi:nitroreductase family protein [Shewanella woodyi]|uniref:nitroreductase family protein n=1 Tax=Shewanella woodyi TaxID=60961 RepID=UPI0007F8FC1B|nr:nitroreductase family protein [Shewanella woodyi]
MSLINALNWRYAVNQFSSQILSEEQLAGLIESVRLSPASYGIQPYQLMVIANEEVKQRCLAHSYGQNKVADCSHLLVFAHKTEVTRADIGHFIEQLAKTQGKRANTLTAYQTQIESDLLSRSTQQQSEWAQQQCYIALGTMLTFAAANKIDAAPMTGFDINGINLALGLPELGLSAAILCPVGERDKSDVTINRTKHRLTHEQLVIVR